MPIQSGDIKLVATQVMDDVPEGGGAPTSTVIADGARNAIFPDVSELDRAGGRVNLRKLCVSVQTPDTDSFLGSNLIVAEPPQDPNISITLFSTANVFDRRDAAKSRIESYLNQGPEWPGYLYENHIAGQRAIQILQRPGTELPPVGRTLALVGNEGQANEFRQYVRVTRVSAVERTFYDADTKADYRAALVTADISDPLRYDFTGTAGRRDFSRAAGAARVRDTLVADAASYAGVTGLQAPIALGAFSAKAGSIYTALVPSAQTETPIVAALPYSAAGLPVPGQAPVTYTAAHDWTPAINFYLPGGCLPGSLSIATAGLVITDDGGLLKTTSGEIGRIDYANGILTLSAGAMSGSKTVTYTPAAQLLRAPQSTEVPVTIESRSQSYTGVIAPLAQPGTLAVAFRAQNRWYALADAGNGRLKGLDAAYGAGTYNAGTGAFSVTLGALPDVGSSLIFTWSAPTQETAHPPATLKATQRIMLTPPAGKAVQPGSVNVAWTYAGAKTATANAAGVLSGDASGQVGVARGFIDFAPGVLPAVGTELTVTYTAGPKQEDHFAHPSRDGAGKLPVTASLGAIQPGSLEVEWNTFTSIAVLGTYTWRQLAEMGIADITNTARPVIAGVDPTQYAHDDGAGKVWMNGAEIGTVNYGTGVVTWNPDVVIKIPVPEYAAREIGFTTFYRLGIKGIGYVDAPSIYPNDESGYVKLRYNSAAAPGTITETVTFAPSITLVPGVAAQAVPGSVLLQIAGGGPWGDSGTGALREFTPTGWLTRGTIDYLTGAVALTTWVAGTANSIARASCATTVGEAISSEYVFRAASAPLRPGTLSVQFARPTGGQQSVTADANGVISAAGVSGQVDYEAGIVRVRFGAMVTAAGNEAEPWYHAANVVAGQIWKPQPVAMSTVRYNATAYTYLPMDAGLLGLDPVRLPSDGRVPIFRPGGFVVIGNTQSISATVANTQVIDCARVRLSRVRVLGANGVAINTGFTMDLEAGRVTFTDVSGYAQPVTIEHRIEDMLRLSDVQIDGSLAFTRAVTHAYPVLGSYISSALVSGDLKAYTAALFGQGTWQGAWADAVSGASTTGKYNDVLAPIVVTNQGASTERWALVFTNTTAFNIVGEHVGVVGTGSINTDTAPINPATGVPYFTVKALGWGTGWAAGNALRFNTIGALAPVWVVRTIQQGPNTGTEHSFTLLSRGDVDRP